MAYSKALTLVKGGSDRIFGKEFMIVEHMAQLRNAAKDFDCAVQILNPYEQSKDKAINVSAEGAIKALRLLEGWVIHKYKVLRMVADDKLSTGEVADEAATMTSNLDQIWEALLLSAAAATHAITAVDPATKKLGRFTLTREQRTAFLSSLTHTFGHEIDRGMQPGQPYPDHVAALLFGFVSDQRWQSAPSTEPASQAAAKKP